MRKNIYIYIYIIYTVKNIIYQIINKPCCRAKCVWETVNPCQQPLKLNVTKYNIAIHHHWEAPPHFRGAGQTCVYGIEKTFHGRFGKDSFSLADETWILGCKNVCPGQWHCFLFHVSGLFGQSETGIGPSAQRAPRSYASNIASRSFMLVWRLKTLWFLSFQSTVRYWQEEAERVGTRTSGFKNSAAKRWPREDVHPEVLLKPIC